MSDSLTLKVETPTRLKEAGYGRARLDPVAYAELGLTIGSIIEIKGKKTVVAKVFRSDPEDSDKGIVRIDGLTRTSAGVSIGDNVVVRRIDPPRALKVTLSPNIPPGSRISIDDKFIDVFKNNLIGRAVCPGLDITVPNVSLMGNRSVFKVQGCSPAGAVIISDMTEIRVLDSPGKGKNQGSAEEPGFGRDNKITTYDDIGGLDEELRRIRDMIELPLKHPELFDRMGISAPKGVLLYGPPGTGKTLIAEALANESGASFLTIRGPEIMGKFYGESEERLRSVFAQAEKSSPSIIFIDEIDSIAPNRNNIEGEVERRVVAQLLTLMDGMGGRGNVIVIGATNQEDSIDPALRRPGRFDREIEIGIPNRDGRKSILDVHTRTMPLDEDVDIDAIARMTHGFVGADLAALCREAAMKCLARHMDRFDLEKPVPTELLEKMRVDMDDFLRAFSEVEPSGMREVSVEIPKITWDDIGGLDGIRNELREVLLPGEEKKDFERLGISAGKGVLLYGPPGTGKTLIAKAVANESGSNFILVNGPELMNKYVGQSEENLRKVFKRARQMAPSVIFFDELDSLAPRRNGEESSRAADNMVAQLLTALDGVEQLNNVLVVAATNRPDMVDPAVLRPGRIDRMILVGKPDTEARLGILKVHTKKMPLGKDVDLAHIAEVTDGYVGADLFSLCREAGLNAYREDHAIESVCLRHFEKAMEIVRPSVDDMTYKAYTEMASKARNNRDRWSNTQFYS
ncbi:MAG: CDC48 family AAA ATPase [Methanomethylophilus alvi]|uniref:CDC48 family AAA ATPase n=1 Tax=Methanomethylophilus alvi TaxID=1291540 RepID=UPI002AA0E9B2|nr:CDC48 family AAA ATPase [Methanomethylophilus alvi]